MILPAYRSFSEVVARNRHRSAMITEGGEISFKELEAEINKVSGTLAVAGIGKGSRVAIISPNSARTAKLIFGIMNLGGVSVPLNIRLTNDELLSQIEFVAVSHVVVGNIPGINIKSSDSRLTIQMEELFTNMGRQSVRSADVSETDPIAILFSSGSSSYPKGVPLTYGNFIHHTLGVQERLNLDEKDKWLLSLPLYHIGGFAILFRCFVAGVPVAYPISLSPDDIAQAMSDYDPTVLSLVPTMIERLGKKKNVPNESHRILLVGGGPSQVSKRREWRENGWKVIPTYGMTETCSQVTTLSPSDDDHIDSAGTPLKGMRLKICDMNGNEVSSGLEGEIHVQGPAVTEGYIGSDDLNLRLFINRWFKTGDYGYLDKEGYLYPVSRRMDMIVTGGENVNPVEVEEAIKEYPGVDDVCVFPLKDDEWGEVVAAAIVPEGIDKREIDNFLDKRIAAFKIPKRYYPLSELPYSESGKLLRDVLIKRFT